MENNVNHRGWNPNRNQFQDLKDFMNENVGGIFYRWEILEHLDLDGPTIGG